MKTKSLVTFLVVFILIALSNSAEARLKLTPRMLDCPDTSVGQAVDCSYIEVKNNNILLSTSIADIRIGDDENFTIDTSACIGKTLRAKATCNIPVTFNPTLARDFDSSLVVYYAGTFKQRTASADVYGRGIRPVVLLSSETADFGEQTVNTSHYQFVTMKNIGSDTLNIDNITVPLGSGFRVVSLCGDALEVAESCLIQIFFEPTRETSYAATVEINDDAEDSPQSIEATGTGTPEGLPDVHLDKTHIDYGSEQVWATSTDTITVTNAGTVPLTIASIVASGTDYSQTNDCGVGLAVDGSCTITVTFAPITVGAFSGLITLNDNAADSPQTITLEGKGVSPDAILTPGVIEFGHQTIDKTSDERQVVLLNSGTSDLTITEITTSDSVYTQTNDCPATLGAKKSCSIYVAFSPTATGFVSGTLSVQDDATSGSPQVVFLFGTGITGPDVDIVPGLHDFGDIEVGKTSQPQDFEVTNTGDGDLSIYSITANSDFAQTNDCPATLAEEETCTIEAVFTPEVSGNFFGFLSIVDDATGSPQKANMWGYGTSSDVTLLPASVNFGNQTVDKSSLVHDILFQNSGNTAITITSIETGSTVFTQTNDCAVSIAPTEFCTISATFTPSSLGEVSGAITITDDASGSPHNVDLFGVGIDPVYPDIDISPKFWDFGPALVGTTSDVKAFAVKNTGVADLEIYSIDTNSEFAQTNDCPATLAAGDTCTISVTFSPQSSGHFSGHIRVIDNTPDGYQLVSLVGTATHSGDIDLSLSTSEVDFGSVSINTTSDSQTVIVTNSGTSDLIIGAVTLEGSDSAYFSKSTNCQEANLDVGKSCLIDIAFNPLVVGSQTAVVMLYDDAVGSPHSVLVTGNGTGVGGCSLMSLSAPDLLVYILIAIVPCLICIFTVRRRFICHRS